MDTECCYDFVQVFDGDSPRERMLAAFSGSSLPDNITASSGYMLIYLRSDKNEDFEGFTAMYDVHACPKDCEFNCNTHDATCSCHQHSSGGSCRQACDENTCSGRCRQNGDCDCDAGYGGHYCDLETSTAGATITTYAKDSTTIGGAWTQISPPGTNLRASAEHSTVFLRDCVYVFGGTDLNVVSNTISRYCFRGNNSNQWTTMEAKENITWPAARRQHQWVAMTHSSRYIYMFGGVGFKGEYLDSNVWRYDVIDQVWTIYLQASDSPEVSNRARHTLTIVNSTWIYLIGGSSSSLIFEMDVYRLEIDSTASSTAASPTTTSPTWQLVTYSGENRLALCVQAHSVVYDSRTDALMIFGGYTIGGVTAGIHRSDALFILTLNNNATSGRGGGNMLSRIHYHKADSSPSSSPSPVDSVPSPLVYHSAEIHGDYMYIYGGNAGNESEVKVNEGVTSTRRPLRYRRGNDSHPGEPKVGGTKEYCYSDKLFIYNLRNHTWIPAPLIDTNFRPIKGRYSSSLVLAYGHSLFVVGGYRGNVLDDFLSYRIPPQFLETSSYVVSDEICSKLRGCESCMKHGTGPAVGPTSAPPVCKWCALSSTCARYHRDCKDFRLPHDYWGNGTRLKEATNMMECYLSKGNGLRMAIYHYPVNESQPDMVVTLKLPKLAYQLNEYQIKDGLDNNNITYGTKIRIAGYLWPMDALAHDTASLYYTYKNVKSTLNLALNRSTTLSKQTLLLSVAAQIPSNYINIKFRPFDQSYLFNDMYSGYYIQLDIEKESNKKDFLMYVELTWKSLKDRSSKDITNNYLEPYSSLEGHACPAQISCTGCTLDDSCVWSLDGQVCAAKLGVVYNGTHVGERLVMNSTHCDSCNSYITCEMCTQSGACEWASVAKLCIRSGRFASGVIREAVRCPKCSVSLNNNSITTCEQCVHRTSVDCMWSTQLSTCYPTSEYLMKYTSGTSAHWVDGYEKFYSPQFVGNENCHSCSAHKDCRSCTQHYPCGWCSLNSNPNKGVCSDGTHSGLSDTKATCSDLLREHLMTTTTSNPTTSTHTTSITSTHVPESTATVSNSTSTPNTPISIVEQYASSWNYLRCPLINECDLHLDDCNVNAVCSDDPEGYTCRCKDHYKGNGHLTCVITCFPECEYGTCSDNITCDCDLGWTGAFCNQSCGCNNHSTCINGTGKCDLCQQNTRGDNCEMCMFSTYGDASKASGCTACDCNQHSNTAKGVCDIHNGTCHCLDNTTGRRCDTCEPGYHGDPRDGKPCYKECTGRELITNANKGYITSYNTASYNMVKTRYCYWLITGDPTLVAARRSTSDALLSFTMHTDIRIDCRKAHVKVYDGASLNASLLATFCSSDGLAEPLTVYSSTSSIIVLYSTDIRDHEGFNASYQILNKDKNRFVVVIKKVDPTARFGHSTDDFNSTLTLLFGGLDLSVDDDPSAPGSWSSQGQSLNDLYIYDIDETWIILNITSDKPSARYLHATTIIDSKLYMHGGSTNSRELWSFNIDNRMWTLINTTMPDLIGHTMTSVDKYGIIVFIGGYSHSDGYNRNVYTFKVQGQRVIKMSHLNAPLVYGHTSTYVPHQDTIYVYGGIVPRSSSSSDDHSTLYAYQQFRWRRIARSDRRYLHSAALVSNSYLVFVGGSLAAGAPLIFNIECQRFISQPPIAPKSGEARFGASLSLRQSSDDEFNVNFDYIGGFDGRRTKIISKVPMINRPLNGNIPLTRITLPLKICDLYNVTSCDISHDCCNLDKMKCKLPLVDTCKSLICKRECIYHKECFWCLNKNRCIKREYHMTDSCAAISYNNRELCSECSGLVSCKSCNNLHNCIWNNNEGTCGTVSSTSTIKKCMTDCKTRVNCSSCVDETCSWINDSCIHSELARIRCFTGECDPTFSSTRPLLCSSNCHLINVHNQISRRSENNTGRIHYDSLCSECNRLEACGYCLKGNGAFGVGVCLAGDNRKPSLKSCSEYFQKPDIVVFGSWKYFGCPSANECKGKQMNVCKDEEKEACFNEAQGYSCTCKAGYVSNNSSKCVPECSKGCIHGNCNATNKCVCDFGYKGEICDEKCKCNGHSDCLDLNNLENCTNCVNNTMGDHCEYCDLFYIGDPTKPGGYCFLCDLYCKGHSSLCISIDDNDLYVNQNIVITKENFSKYIKHGPLDVTQSKCLHCSDHTTGDHCEVCEAGFYRDPYSKRCVRCKCSGNADWCNIETGEHCKCTNNTMTVCHSSNKSPDECNLYQQCQACKPYYMGNPINGRLCYSDTRPSHIHCLYPSSLNSNSNKCTHDLKRNVVIAFHIEQSKKIDMRFTLDVTYGELELYMCDDHQSLQLTSDLLTGRHSVLMHKKPERLYDANNNKPAYYLTVRHRSQTIVVQHIRNRLTMYFPTSVNTFNHSNYFIIISSASVNTAAVFYYNEVNLKIHLFVFFSVFFSCFFLLLSLCILLWKLKSIYEHHWHVQQRKIEMVMMASRPFASVLVSLLPHRGHKPMRIRPMTYELLKRPQHAVVASVLISLPVSDTCRAGNNYQASAVCFGSTLLYKIPDTSEHHSAKKTHFLITSTCV